MHPIPPDVTPNSDPAEIANLQAALLLLLERGRIDVPDDERRALLAELGREREASAFRDATMRTLMRFREQRGLEPGEIVDERTAAALNRELEALGAFEQPTAESGRRIVAGQVSRRDGTPFAANISLRAGVVLLGEAATDPEGRYAIPYALPGRAASALLRVAAFDREGRLRAEASAETTTPITVVNLVVQSELYRVSGRVASAGRAGLNGLRVAIIDRNVGGETLVADGAVDSDGHYSIAFSYDGPKPCPDLQARAFRGANLLGASAVRYNAGAEEMLDIALAAAAEAALPAEHEALAADIAAHFAGSLRELQETDERQDLTFLANKTGWDARAVALAALADQFSARAADPVDGATIAPELFYTLFRAGLPASDAGLYRADSVSVAAVWTQGVEQGVIPASLANSFPAALERFKTLAAKELLAAPALAGQSSLAEMLAVSLPDTTLEQQETFARLQVEHQATPATLWPAVERELGRPAMLRLRLDGQLGYLTLNNAPLIAKLHVAEQGPLADPLELIGRGLYRPEAWQPLVADTPVPPEIPGAGEEQRRANYADLLAAQLRLSYPTATVAAMVSRGETPIAEGMVGPVRDFLLEHHETFAIGAQPVEQFVARGVAAPPEVQAEITRIQRVRQLTTDDEAMNALLRAGLDSAFAIAQYDREAFVRAFQNEVGGAAAAALIHSRAAQIYGVMLNIATSYLVASNAPSVGVHSPAQIIRPAPNVPANVGDIIAYPTLEQLFGELDYCACEHCRSVLSPAAYLVDLLQFLDRDPDQWARFLAGWPKDHKGLPYPYTDSEAWERAGRPVGETATPLEVLLSRRPDLQHLPLTCANTNTRLPSIDLVNEVLEYVVVNEMQIADYTGHSIDGSASAEELLASPQFVQNAAYAILAGSGVPAPPLPPIPPLPFHRPLEAMRQHCDALAAPLPRLLEALRVDDALERPNDEGYGWRDIWMEELRLSRPEYTLLTRRELTLQTLYGFPAATSDADVLAELASVKAFARRLALSYEELLAILRTRFVNPAGALLPLLERLGVSLVDLKNFKEGALDEQQFAELLAPGLNPAPYGGDIVAWARDENNYQRFMGLLTLADPSGSGKLCSFDALVFRYADPERLNEPVRPFEFVRLLRFIRLWRKLGWSIEQTDKAIVALYPPEQAPDLPDDGVNLQRLDAGFLSLLPRLGALRRVMDELRVRPDRDLLPLLACFAPLDSYGDRSLYRSLFLRPSLLTLAPAFALGPSGEPLDGSARLLNHQEALRAALALSGDELGQIVDALGYDANTPLTIATASAIFRRGWLARRLKLSVRELLLLSRLSGIDPFAPLDPVVPPALRFLALVRALNEAGLKPHQALALIWNQVPGGQPTAAPGEISAFARTLREALSTVERELAVVEDPDGQIARARMALVYDGEATDTFFGLLENNFVTPVAYSQLEDTLPEAVRAATAGRLAYDPFRKQLLFTGVLTAALRDQLKVGASVAFEQSVDRLYAANQLLVGEFFARYPELQQLYDGFVAAADPPSQRRSKLLASFLPELKRRRKRQAALQTLAAAAGVEVAFAATLLANHAVLHAATDPAAPALDDLLAIERPGLSATIFLGSTTAAPALAPLPEPAAVNYGPGLVPLPPNDGPISGIWSGFVAVPESGLYNLRVVADVEAHATLELADTPLALVAADGVWENAAPLELRGGALYPLALAVEQVSARLSLQWQSVGRGWEPIPADKLYAATLSRSLSDTYMRFFKAASLAAALKLAPAELAHLAAHPDGVINGQGWLNLLSVEGDPAEELAPRMLPALEAVLAFAQLKAALSPDDGQLLAALQAPTGADGKVAPQLLALTRWESDALALLLARFGNTPADLGHLAVFQRVAAAFALVDATGIPAAALLATATNDPTADTVRSVEAALYARYGEADWLRALRPINDRLRATQRDALVAYILHQMRASPASAHIDTPDKLFEYFLMDVQLEPCTETSRILHATLSAQTFIERCLMNLERRVGPAALNGKHWQWMRRYRVWEANRKVFLWPENWLEPELRDDQSPFFKELMSELLQGDITEDRAGVALGNYLAKLDEVAKLEPCGIHVVEGEPGARDDVSHVVARTAGAKRRYYYRRREHGSWTPWEQIKLDIEDDPVLPVVWKGRLLLFWLRIIQQAVQPSEPPLPPGTELIKLNTAKIKTQPGSFTVGVILCWSEFYNGAWQPTRTSDVEQPSILAESSLTAGKGGGNRAELATMVVTNPKLFAPGEFSRSNLRLSVLESAGLLQVNVSSFPAQTSFVLYNTHGAPVSREQFQAEPGARFADVGRRRSVQLNKQTFALSHLVFGAAALDRPILTTKTGIATVVQARHPLGDAWGAPFLYADARHVFYVSVAQRTVKVSKFERAPAAPPGRPPATKLVIPPLVLDPLPRIPDIIGPVIAERPEWAVNPGLIERFVREEAAITKGIGAEEAVAFGDRLVGLGGSIKLRG